MKLVNNISDIEKHLEKSIDIPQEDSYNDLDKLVQVDKCKTRLLKYIVFKKRTKQEIINIFSNDFDAETLDVAIEELEKNGYINDTSYIQRAISEFMAIRTLSIKEIKYKLLSKGLKAHQIDDYIDEHIDELDLYEQNCIEKIMNKKSNLEPYEVKQYLLKKGYKSENIKVKMAN